MRNLHAIEIAEGALLADIAVVFRLISIVLPVAGLFFELFIFVTFAVLVLRRGFYVGMMGLCVALFLVCVMVGPQRCVSMSLDCAGGLFLGVTLQYRWHFIPLVIVGSICGSLTLYIGLFAASFALGYSFQTFILSLHHGINIVLPILANLATRLGLGPWWQQSANPFLHALIGLLFAYWWLTLYIALFLILLVGVSGIYVVTHMLISMLGYDLRPFPGGRLGRIIQRYRRRLFKLSLKWPLTRKLWSRF